MNRRWTWVALVAAMALVAGAVWWLRPPLAQAVTAQVQPLQRSLQFSARVASRSRVDVGATLTGRVLAVRVREGDRVRAGQTLLVLEDAELQATLAQALASQQQAAARLAGVLSTGRSGARAVVAQAESVWQAARSDAARTRELVASGFLSPARQDESQRALDVAQAQLDAARVQDRAAGERGTEQAQAQAQLNAARAAAQAARARLQEVQLLAPTAAQVLAREVEPGQIVQPGRALLTLALQGPLELKALVDERYLQQLQVGQSATVRPDAYVDRSFDARISAIAPLVDAQRGAVEVTLQLVGAGDGAGDGDVGGDAGEGKAEAAGNPADRNAPSSAAASVLREDMTVTVDVLTGRRERALVVPLDALRPDPGAAPQAPDQALVWLAQGGRVQSRAVRTGLRNLQALEVRDGLAVGDQVLVGPAPPPGSRVRVRVQPPPAGNIVAPTPGGGTAATSAAGKGAGNGNGNDSRADTDAGSALTNAIGR